MTEQTLTQPITEKPDLKTRLGAVLATLKRDENIFVNELFGTALFGVGALLVAAAREKSIPQDDQYFPELFRRTGIGRLVTAFRTGIPPTFEENLPTSKTPSI